MDAMEALFGEGADLVDLTHAMAAGMPVWPTHPHYCQTVVESYDRGDVACNHGLCMSEHTGTHFDAPVHFLKGRAAILDLPVERFFCRMAVLDATDVAPGGSVEPARIRDFEAEHGALRRGDAVFFRFGWDRFWDDPADHPRVLSDWPGLSAEASELLVARGAGIVGTDCLSIDRFGTSDFPAHNILLGAGLAVGENFARLAGLPAYATLFAPPLAIAGGTGAPARAVALVRR